MSSLNSSSAFAIVIDEFGGPGVIRLREQQMPRTAHDQASVKPAYAGVDFVDLYQRRGRYPGVPLALGVEGAGEIVRASAGGGFTIGDRTAVGTASLSAQAAVEIDALVWVRA